MRNPFSADAMAAGYAAARPPVHPHIIALLQRWLQGRRPRLTVDIGCGAGLSTQPLLPWSQRCLGFDPAESMVRAARRVVPGARFLAAAAESMPLADRTVDLLAAAGSLNYAQDLDRVWHEAHRVLAAGGTLAVYDFSAGRQFPGDPALERWFTEFTERFPYPRRQAIALSPAILAARATGFTTDRAESFALRLPLTPDFYLEYVLTETNVQAAADAGTALETIRAWCARTLRPVFGGVAREVVFSGYLVQLRPSR